MSDRELSSAALKSSFDRNSVCGTVEIKLNLSTTVVWTILNVVIEKRDVVSRYSVVRVYTVLRGRLKRSRASIIAKQQEYHLVASKIRLYTMHLAVGRCRTSEPSIPRDSLQFVTVDPPIPDSVQSNTPVHKFCQQQQHCATVNNRNWITTPGELKCHVWCRLSDKATVIRRNILLRAQCSRRYMLTTLLRA